MYSALSVCVCLCLSVSVRGLLTLLACLPWLNRLTDAHSPTKFKKPPPQFHYALCGEMISSRKWKIWVPACPSPTPPKRGLISHAACSLSPTAARASGRTMRSTVRRVVALLPLLLPDGAAAKGLAASVQGMLKGSGDSPVVAVACCGAGRGVAAGALGRWDFEAKLQAARRLLAAQAPTAPFFLVLASALQAASSSFAFALC